MSGEWSSSQVVRHPRSRTVAVIVTEKRRLVLIVEHLHLVILSPTRPTFSPYSTRKKQTCKTSESTRHLREREMNAQERGETSDDEQEGEETEDEGYFTPR
jgi:transposase